MSRTLIECQDLDWFAIDTEGHVALLASGGSRFVPECYQERIDLAFEIANFVQQLPVVGHHSITNGQPSTWRNETWTSASDQGLFGFDFDVETDAGYNLFTIPTVPKQFTVEQAPWITMLPIFNGSFKRALFIEASLVFGWQAGSTGA
jgi:hypothetical protein